MLRTPARRGCSAAASRILPGGVDSPVRAFKSVGATPIFIDRGAGRDIRGRGRQHLHRLRHVLGSADARPRAERAREGIGRGRVARHELRRADRARDAARAASRDADAVDRAGPVRELGDRGDDERAPGGTRGAPKRDKIIKFEGCYHGHADAFLVKAGSGAMTLGVPTSPGVPAARRADTLVARYNDLESVERLLAQNRRADRRRLRRADRRQHGRGAAARRIPQGPARNLHPGAACS